MGEERVAITDVSRAARKVIVQREDIVAKRDFREGSGARGTWDVSYSRISCAAWDSKIDSSERAFWRRGEVSETGSGGSSWRGGFLEGIFVVFFL